MHFAKSESSLSFLPKINIFPENQHFFKILFQYIGVKTAAPLLDLPEIALGGQIHFPVQHGQIQAGDEIVGIYLGQGIPGLAFKMFLIAFILSLISAFVS